MIKKLWHTISDLGIRESTSYHDARNIRIFNRISFLILLGLLVPIIILIFDWKLEGIFLLYTFIVMASGLTLNYFSKTNFSCFLVFICLAVGISIHMICFGNNYIFYLVYLCLIALTFSFFKNRLDISITSGFIFICWLGSRVFLLFNDPLIYQEQPILKNDIIFLIVSAIYLTILGLFISESRAKNSEKKILLDELQQKNDALESAYKDLESFTYIASHDLKTPVRTINSFLSLIKTKTDSIADSELKEYVTFAKNGASKLHTLIADILNYSKSNLEQNENKDLIDLNDLLKEISYIIKGQEKYKVGIIKSNLMPLLIANRTSFHQLFQNIIENGMKYNDKDIPEVKVNAEATDSVLKISFQDNGIGIGKEYQDLIFEPFKRLHTDNNYEGTGVGLAICKRIVENMQGTISINSLPNEGSTIKVHIPVRSGYLQGRKVLKVM